MKYLGIFILNIYFCNCEKFAKKPNFQPTSNRLVSYINLFLPHNTIISSISSHIITQHPLPYPNFSDFLAKQIKAITIRIPSNRLLQCYPTCTKY